MSLNNSVLATAQKTFDTEITELQKVRNSLGASFTEAVEKILQCRGKLVVTGIGKSAHIANKIVATLNSTGTTAQFLHAAEAIHGDLGILKKEDVVLCISYSGNSPEIATVAPYLKNNSSCLIALTGNPDSKLAEHADLVINSHVDAEACPNHLAPTSSTTVQLVIGDALAVCLMQLKNFKEQDFAKFHPGGSLGKNLTATVGQFLSSQKPQVSPEATLRDVIISVSGSHHGITAVLENDEIVGVITDGDLRRMLLRNENISGISAKDIMTKNPKTIDQSVLAKEAMSILKKNNIGQLIVTNNDKYVGIIDLHRLLDEGII